MKTGTAGPDLFRVDYVLSLGNMKRKEEKKLVTKFLLFRFLFMSSGKR